MGKNRFTVKSRENLGMFMDANVLVDKETGVNYLYVNYGSSGGLTPLLDADGKPIITKAGDGAKDGDSTKDGYRK